MTPWCGLHFMVRSGRILNFLDRVVEKEESLQVHEKIDL
jgi:hypothetical protein